MGAGTSPNQQEIIVNSRKKSIWVGEALERALAERVEEGRAMRSTSGVINSIADRYGEVVRRSMPSLSQNEWMLIFDSLNGVILSDSAQSVAGLWGGIEDSIRLDGLDEKWQVNGPALVDRLRALSYPEQVAIADTAERFWAQFGNKDVQFTEALVALGIKAAREISNGH
jgi:hypothetical protein